MASSIARNSSDISCSARCRSLLGDQRPQPRPWPTRSSDNALKVCKLFLCQTPFLPNPPDVLSDQPAHVHARGGVAGGHLWPIGTSPPPCTIDCAGWIALAPVSSLSRKGSRTWSIRAVPGWGSSRFSRFGAHLSERVSFWLHSRKTEQGAERQSGGTGKDPIANGGSDLPTTVTRNGAGPPLYAKDRYT
jgi:hypothetical protein